MFSNTILLDSILIKKMLTAKWLILFARINFVQESAVVGRDRGEQNAAGNEVLTEGQHDGLRTFTGAYRDEWGRRDVYDATVSLQTGFRQQRQLASDRRSENRKPYLPVAVAGGHLRRRPLSLLGLTPGLGLAPIQFELHGSCRVSEFCILQRSSLSRKCLSDSSKRKLCEI